MVLDVRESSNLADFFLFATAESSRQFQAIAETLRVSAKSHGLKTGGAEGLGSGRWALIDLYDVIVHVFDPEARQFYDLELLWGDAPRVDWSSIETPLIPRAVPTRESRVVESTSLPE